MYHHWLGHPVHWAYSCNGSIGHREMYVCFRALFYNSLLRVTMLAVYWNLCCSIETCRLNFKIYFLTFSNNPRGEECPEDTINWTQTPNFLHLQFGTIGGLWNHAACIWTLVFHLPSRMTLVTLFNISKLWFPYGQNESNNSNYPRVIKRIRWRNIINTAECLIQTDCSM